MQSWFLRKSIYETIWIYREGSQQDDIHRFGNAEQDIGHSSLLWESELVCWHGGWHHRRNPGTLTASSQRQERKNVIQIIIIIPWLEWRRHVTQLWIISWHVSCSSRFLENRKAEQRRCGVGSLEFFPCHELLSGWCSSSGYFVCLICIYLYIYTFFWGDLSFAFAFVTKTNASVSTWQNVPVPLLFVLVRSFGTGS